MQKITPEEFIEKNLEILSEEAAIGNGPHMNTLGKLMGCSETSLPRFRSLLKKGYRDIFQISSSMPILVFKKIENAIIFDTKLQCSLLY